ncbi:MAG: (deoxy)nucleoside triphosphate pyrophosphohydrolase [Succinatimonas sp.]|nr:(deoxy)nucleoside triphosphate pyrophosphohydrolase [Succinatimonas sp.]MCI7024482.1 (deoxy)nucleoside triphosphate pyrophosphohydrolase [Succinatimonas sp.]MDD6754704.1 (deoxy)nucleoside triphosphate pyrophosphohydrolase [Succinatimonas sp.]MDY6262593.1 (deoxy)nucleoside triphosphate pyrophosphohydrolase [Succinivibrio sp.]
MKTINVVAAIIIKDNKIFATQRGYGEFKDGWEFPGGKVELGEAPENAIVREIKEELDTVIEVIEYFDTVEYDYPNFHLSMKCYICTVVSGKLELLEHEAAKWLDKDSLDSVAWLPADLGLVDKLKDYLSKNRS